MIKTCACKHTKQDKLHGKGRRVFNPSKDGSKATCTVCGTKVIVK